MLDGSATRSMVPEQITPANTPIVAPTTRTAASDSRKTIGTTTGNTRVPSPYDVKIPVFWVCGAADLVANSRAFSKLAARGDPQYAQYSAESGTFIEAF